MKEYTKTDNTPVYQISIAAKLMGISVHTLRMYERENLIIPFKTDTNRRLYSDTDIQRIKKLRYNINQNRFSIRSIRMISSIIPCWRQMNCSEEDRKGCKAYKELDKPCWAYKNSDNMCGVLECRECVVYKTNIDVIKTFEVIVSAFVEGNKLPNNYEYNCCE